MLPSSKPNLVQASLGSCIYWICGESESIITICLIVLLGKEELKRRSYFAFLYWVLIWFAPISCTDTLLGVTSFCGCLHDKLVFLNRSQLPVCFIANRSDFLFQTQFCVLSAEYAIHHASKPGLSMRLLASSFFKLHESIFASRVYCICVEKCCRCSPESCI